MNNRNPIKYFVFFPGGFKEEPIYLYSDNKTQREPSLCIVSVITHTPHLLIRVTRSEIIEIIKHFQMKLYRKYFDRDSLKNIVINLDRFYDDHSSQLDTLKL